MDSLKSSIMSKLKYYATSIGCKVNAYEVNALKPLLEKEGFVESLSLSDADIIIFNSCAVTEVAAKKSRQMIRRLRREGNNEAIVVVMGCYSNINPNYIKDDLGADIVIGTRNRDKIPTLIKDYLLSNKKIALAPCDYHLQKYEELSTFGLQEHVRAYVKIQDGCNNFCSYCLIPYLRGRSVSRNPIDILNEVHNLVKNGYKEIVLTGIDTAWYGNDLDHYTFVDLLKDILEKNQELMRLRISSIEESQISDDFINLLRDDKRIASHLHVSLQSGSLGVLRRMNRKYNPNDFYEKVCKIREAVPDIALTTDVIVGFPGETEEEFCETFNFIKKVNFAMLHVFPYSRRKGTVADKMDNQITPSVKKQRVNELISLSDKLWDAYKKGQNGKDFEILIESFDKKTNKYKGHSSNYIEVEIASDTDIIGEIVKLKYKYQ